MIRPRLSRRLASLVPLGALMTVVGTGLGPAAAAEPGRPSGKPNYNVNYSRDIQPVFANHCYACHGPDAESRQADLRLDVRDVAVKEAIVPGKAAKSPLAERIAGNDDDERMPPPDSRKARLTPEQVALVRRWIDEGATYEIHWAYVPPKQTPPPDVDNKQWAANPIDRFVAAVQNQHGRNISAV